MEMVSLILGSSLLAIGAVALAVSLLLEATIALSQRNCDDVCQLQRETGFVRDPSMKG